MRMLGAVTLLTLLLGGMVACNGGGGTNVAGGGTGGTGAVAYGTVTDLGSIQVNGIWWTTDGAEIYLDSEESVPGQALPGGGEGLLRKGMIVKVEGSTDTVDGKRRAATIRYRKTLQGPVEGASTASRFTVLRQTVMVDPSLTQLEGIDDTAYLAEGDMVEVNGYTAPDGTIHATYIKAKPGDTGLEIRGTILSVDPDSPSRFNIGGLIVDADSIGWNASYRIGERVRVTGTVYGNGVLTAESVDAEDARIHPEDIDEAHLEGVVTTMATATSFALNDQPVNALNAEFHGGDDSAIAPGVRLEVEGAIRDGILVAAEVSFADAIELAAPVESVGVDTLTLGALVTTEGTPITLSVRENVTEYEGDQVSGLGDIAVGDYVEVRARESGGVLLATKISGQGPAETEPTIVLQGSVDPALLNEPVVNLLGIEIDTSNPDLTISDDSGQLLSSQELIGALQNNPDAVVEVAGTWSAGAASVAWKTLELDD